MRRLLFSSYVSSYISSYISMCISMCVMTLIVSCSENKDDVPVNPRVFYGIKIASLPNKTTFLLGEAIDFEGLKVVELFTDGYEKENTTYTLQMNDSRFRTGKKTVSITARNITESFDITVENKLVDTGLPVVFIETQHGQQITTKDTYITATMTIFDSTGQKLYSGPHGIRGRGHATWGYPKKPYRLKLDTKANLLDMGENKHWALLANYCDKTLMRTSIGFKLSETLDFPWTPKSSYVEFVLNGEYMGNYQLVEAVRQGDTRVNIPESGFIIERDGYYNQEPVWFTTPRGFGYTFKNPDTEELTPAQFDYIKDYMHDFETALYGNDFKDPASGYANYVEMESFARWFLLHLMLANMDTNPYIVKADMSNGSKLEMGPVWDFEWSLGIGWYDGPRPRPANYYVHYADFYFQRLLQDADFAATLQKLWETNHTRASQVILQHFTDLHAKLYRSQALNFERWDIMNTRVSVGGIPLGSFTNEVECDRQFFINRMNWIASIIYNF